MVVKLCLVLDHQRPLMPKNVGVTLYPEHFSKFTGIFWSEIPFRADPPPFQ